MLLSAQLCGTMFSLAPEFARARAAASKVINVMDPGSNGKLTKSELQSIEPKSKTANREGHDVEASGEAQLMAALKGANRGTKITFNDVSFS